MSLQALITEPHIWRYQDVLVEGSPEQARWTFVEPDRHDRVLEALETADVYVGLKFDEAMAKAARRLRLLQATSAGVDHLSLDALRPEAKVCNIYGHERSIAEFVVMATMALHRQALSRDVALRAGRWLSPLFGPESPPMRNVERRRLGIVGFGHIGHAVGALAHVLGMRVRAVTRRPDAHERPAWLESLAGLNTLTSMFQASDVVVLAVPLSDELRGLVGSAELEALGADGFLINVGRGELVRERELYEALRDRAIAGAALDVWYRYPQNREDAMPSAFPFHELDNVLLSPHVSGAAEETYIARARLVAENLRRLVAGEPLANEVRTS